MYVLTTYQNIPLDKYVVNEKYFSTSITSRGILDARDRRSSKLADLQHL